jgi:AraC-like DNA-binding protein
MITILAADSADVLGVSAPLRAAGHEVRWFESWSMWNASDCPARALVVVIPWLDTDLTTVPWAELKYCIGAPPMVLLTEEEPSNLRYLGPIVVSEVLYLPRELAELPAAVARVVGRCRLHLLADRVRTSDGIPPLLRRALVYALLQTPASFPVEASQGLPRSVRTLALRLNHSEDHLRRTAKAANISLGSFLDWCVVLHALEIRASHRVSWEEVAWRLGYSSCSGLSEHLNRVLGVRPAQLASSDLCEHRDRCERHLLLPVTSRSIS